MTKKKIYIFSGVILLVGLLVFGMKHYETKASLQLVEASQMGKTQGLLKHELTFNNVLNKFSTHIARGTVTEFTPFSEDRNLAKVSIQEVLAGDFDSDTIEVYAIDSSIFKVGGEYIFFLKKHSSTVYPKDFFVQFTEFLLKVEDGHVKRLINVERGEYVAPFVESQYNNLNELTTYIQKNTKNASTIQKVKAIQSFPNLADLIGFADHIIEIEVREVIPERNNLSVVELDLLHAYKGGSFENVHSLLLPDQLEKGGKYIVFLKNHEDSMTLATREGSIILSGGKEYDELIEVLSDQK